MQSYPVKAVITGDLNMLRSFVRTGIPTVTVVSDPKDCRVTSDRVSCQRKTRQAGLVRDPAALRLFHRAVRRLRRIVASA